jgi:hypothetical protein
MPPRPTPIDHTETTPEVPPVPPAGLDLALGCGLRAPATDLPQIGVITKEYCDEIYGLYGKRLARGEYQYAFAPREGAERLPICHPRVQGELLRTGDKVELFGKPGMWRVELFPVVCRR